MIRSCQQLLIMFPKERVSCPNYDNGQVLLSRNDFSVFQRVSTTYCFWVKLSKIIFFMQTISLKICLGPFDQVGAIFLRRQLTGLSCNKTFINRNSLQHLVFLSKNNNCFICLRRDLGKCFICLRRGLEKNIYHIREGVKS